MSDDIKAIEAATKTYFDGLYEGDAAKLEQVFHPTSALTNTIDGAIKITPRDQWCAMVRSRPSPQKSGLERHDEIVSIDFTGPDMALVKVKCQMPPRYFTDLLSFLKIDGRWQVVQKVFTTETRA
ncbi:MAG: nuclear transport factor 2 family protein [Beijerinckiaceae bacterium]